MTKTLTETLDAIPHRYLKGSIGPEFWVWAGDEDCGACVILKIGALWGEQPRFVDLAPANARKLAALLIAMADQIDSVMEK